MYYRLKKNSDFKKLFSSGKKCFYGGIMLIYRQSDKLRMGVSVSKKHGGSVQRNRLKRQVRAAFYDLSAQINKSCYIVILPKAGQEHSFLNIKSSLLKILSREGLIKND